MRSDLRLLQCLQDYYARHRAMPAFAEAAQLAGIAAVSTVAGMVSRLKGQGYLKATSTGRLQPGARFFERALVSSVRAGHPAPVEDLIPEGLLIDEYLVDAPSRTILLSVKGESMTGAGLLPSDIVIVKRGAPARPGDVVIALVDGEYTIKYLAVDEAGGFYLKSGNPAFADIRPQHDLELYGVVVGQFRKYQPPPPTRSASVTQ